MEIINFRIVEIRNLDEPGNLIKRSSNGYCIQFVCHFLNPRTIVENATAA
jgi:hypothetical protein